MLTELLDPLRPVTGIMLALALGLLIGIERGWARRNDADGSRVAGIRTFGLLGLAGGIAGDAWLRFSPEIGVLVTAVAALVLLAGYIRHSTNGDVSATATIAGLVTLAVGFLAGKGDMVPAAAIAATMTVLLSSRNQLHRWLNTLSEADVQAMARFAVISLAVLPVLPDADYGPFDAWNPRRIWMVVVLVSGLSFAGYVASKRLGETRGILATAAAGAVVSSTAVTAALANRMRNREGDDSILTAGIAIASAVMFLRVLLLVALLAPFSLPALSVTVGPAAAVGLVCAAWLVWRSRSAQATLQTTLGISNPFDIRPAMLLAGLVAVLSLASRWLLSVVGGAGVAVALAVSGMVDVDAAIITMGGLPHDILSPRLAGLILAVPVMLNTIVKTVITIVSVGGTRGWRAAMPLLLGLLAMLPGVAVVLAMPG